MTHGMERWILVALVVGIVGCGSAPDDKAMRDESPTDQYADAQQTDDRQTDPQQGNDLGVTPSGAAGSDASVPRESFPDNGTIDDGPLDTVIPDASVADAASQPRTELSLSPDVRPFTVERHSAPKPVTVSKHAALPRHAAVPVEGSLKRLPQIHSIARNEDGIVRMQVKPDAPRVAARSMIHEGDANPTRIASPKAAMAPPEAAMALPEATMAPPEAPIAHFRSAMGPTSDNVGDAAPLAQPLSVSPAAESSAADPDYTMVEVYYGTDRKPLEATVRRGKIPIPSDYFPAFGLAALALLILSAALFRGRRRTVLAIVGMGCLMGAAALGARSYLRIEARQLAHSERTRVYGNDRGQFEVGTCQVSIPRTHQIGQLEAPSILRLEIREDARKHVMLRSVTLRENSEFYEHLRQRVAESPDRDLFVFVHGFNVTFDDAARRTAQIAHDLKFPGAAVFYSWPSQGGLFKYTIDETNVVWTVPHLKQFLLDVSKNSGAKSVNLIAHSMGNRALTSALRELKYELQGEAIFNQIVLAAPDIDADVFRRDIAPAIQSTARRVTLYASSDDQALIASKNVHGYARAGESGAGLVVIPGIETIDVTGIDTSLLGHSYYGSSLSILADLYEVIRCGQPPSARLWLTKLDRGGVPYWRLESRSQNPEIARPHSHSVQH